MRQEKPLRNEHVRTNCVPVIARFLIGLLLLAGVMALGAWATAHEDRLRIFCIDAQANPACDRLGLDR